MSYSPLELDESLPQLNRVCSGTEMLPLLKCITNTSDDRYSLETCNLHRFRYRRHDRAIMLFDLNMWDNRHQLQQRQWVTGSIYAEQGRSARIYRRLTKMLDIPSWQAMYSTSSPIAYIDEVDMCVQCFPYDRYLPSLSTIMSQRPGDLLATLYPDLTVNNDIDIWQVDPMRYRPYLGTTIRFTNQSAATPQLQDNRLYVKVYRPDEAATAYKFLRSVYDCNANQIGFSVVEPVAYNDQLNTVVLRDAPGVAFDATIHSNNNVIASARRIGESLATFHRDGVVPSRCRNSAETIERATRAVRLLGWCDREIGLQAEQVLSSATPHLKFTTGFATHLDIKPDHIIVGDDQVTFIDMDSSAMSDPVADVATLLVRLDAMIDVGSVDQGTIECVKTTFFDAYRGGLRNKVIEQALESRLSAHMAVASLKVALFYMQHQLPSWREHVSRLLDKASVDTPRRYRYRC